MKVLWFEPLSHQWVAYEKSNFKEVYKFLYWSSVNGEELILAGSIESFTMHKTLLLWSEEIVPDGLLPDGGGAASNGRIEFWSGLNVLTPIAMRQRIQEALGLW